MLGISAIQDPHQVAQRLTKRTLPLNLDSLTFFPSRVRRGQVKCSVESLSAPAEDPWGMDRGGKSMSSTTDRTGATVLKTRKNKAKVQTRPGIPSQLTMAEKGFLLEEPMVSRLTADISAAVIFR